MKLSEVVNRVIDLAGKVRAYYDVELPKYYPNYPLVELEDLDTPKVPPPPEEKALADYLARLPAETIYQLMLIRHLPWDPNGMADLATTYENVKGHVSGPADAVADMMAYKEGLADRLAFGLEELALHKIDVDKMPLKKVKARKR